MNMENVAKAREIIRHVYIVELSTKTKIKIDPSEVESVMRGINEGKMVRVRQGIINPSYVVGIYEDTERRIEFLENTKHELGRRAKGMEPLKDIFGKESLQLESGTVPIGLKDEFKG